MPAASDITEALQAADLLFDGVAATLGHAELVPIADALTRMLQKVTEAVAAKLSEAPVLQAEVAAADAAYEAAKEAKFGGKP